MSHNKATDSLSNFSLMSVLSWDIRRTSVQSYEKLGWGGGGVQTVHRSRGQKISPVLRIGLEASGDGSEW